MDKIIYYYIGEIINITSDYIFPINILKHIENKPQDKINESKSAYYFLDNILKKYTSYSIKDIYFSVNGKPLIDGIFISISHSQGMIVVSFSNINHGIDIERVRNSYSENIAKRYNFGEINNSKEFYEKWTLLESNVKLNNSLSISNIYSKTEFINSNNKQYVFTISSNEKTTIKRIINLDNI